MVRAWDFSGAEEVQQRLDALRLQREAQRTQRRERGRHAGRRLQPRFPPQPDSSDEDGDNADEAGDGASVAAQDGTSQSAAACAVSEDTLCAQDSQGNMMGSQRDADCQVAGRGMGIPNRGHASWTGDDAAAGEQAMSFSLPARLGVQRAGWGSTAGPRQVRPLPPPLVRVSGCCAEAEAARISRMTSWDIQRPRRSSGEGVKVSG